MILRRSRKLCLHIDTKNQKVITVSLKKDGKIIKSLSEENEYGSQVLLPLIVKLLHTPTSGVSLQSHSRSGIRSGVWEMLEEIEVETGQGSFIGLRVGVSVANALGFALGIPVNGKKIETELLYS